MSDFWDERMQTHIRAAKLTTSAAETRQFIQAQLMTNLTREDALDMVRGAQRMAALAREMEGPSRPTERVHDFLSALKSIDDALTQAVLVLEAQP